MLDAGVNNEAEGQVDDDPDLQPSADDDDFDVTSPAIRHPTSDIRHPSSIAISLCVRLGAKGRIVVRLPQSRRFPGKAKVVKEIMPDKPNRILGVCFTDFLKGGVPTNYKKGSAAASIAPAGPR